MIAMIGSGQGAEPAIKDQIATAGGWAERSASRLNPIDPWRYEHRPPSA